MSFQRFFSFLLLTVFLTACSEVAIKPVSHYQLVDRKEFYTLEKWGFEGRLALSNGTDSWTASIEWNHADDKDELKLSGPLGQGAVAISLTKDFVIIDKGDDNVLQSAEVDALVEQQLGVFVPVRALRYWVLGLTAPDTAFVELTDGFEQEKWLVQYRQMQQINQQQWMPRKLRVQQDNINLKLIIDNWTL